ncbi:MAG: alpha/beta fold hydrolase [Sphingomonas sp.]
MNFRSWFPLALAPILALTTAVTADNTNLPRGSFFGARTLPTAEGVTIGDVQPLGTAARMGLRSGDLLLLLNGARITNATVVQTEMRRLSVGSKISADLMRGGRKVHLQATTVSAPTEKYAGASVTYGAVQFRGNLLRDILTRPTDRRLGAVVFFIQGFGCFSIEARTPDGEFAKLAQAFSARGIAFYRVEKPGVGDSTGPHACAENDFATELDGFRTAYRHLADLGYSRDQIFILGHSLGGIEAPLLAAENSPRGVAVYGTILRNWADYMLDLDRLQDFQVLGRDPGATYDRAEGDREAIHRFFFAGGSLRTITSDNPAITNNLTELFGWDGTNHLFGQSETFMRDLAGINLARAWQSSRSRVLSLYGASDVIALSGQDQRDIVDIVNFARPGTAQYLEVPDTMHTMDLVGSRDELRKASIQKGELVNGAFNPEVADRLVEWIERSMLLPPVAR